MRTTELARHDFRALGTGAVVATTSAAVLADAVAAAGAEIEAIDRACSRFRDDSDLQAVNHAAGQAVRVSPTLLDAVEVALDAARWTDGDVDPTIGRALRMLGYDRDFDDVFDGPPVARFGEVPGWRVVAVDRARQTVRVPAGVQLDLGATAKALAADRAAAAAAARAGCGVMVGLGGDLACAGTPPAGGWPVHVAEWHGAPGDGPLHAVSMHSGGLATSSTTVRRWCRGDSDVHHVVDPATGAPAAVHWRTVSVAAASCVQANIATTAAIVRGSRAVPWLEALGVPARLVRHDGAVQRVNAWPQDEA